MRKYKFTRRRLSRMKKWTKKDWKYLSILLSSLFVMMIGFQNCGDNNTIPSERTSNTSLLTTNPSTTTTNTTSPSDSSSIAIEARSQDVASDHFDVNTKVDFVLIAPKSEAQRKVFREYEKFEWSIVKENFKNLSSAAQASEDQEPVAVNRDDPKKTSTEPNYDWTFDEIGVYSISVVPEDSKGQKSEAIYKTLIIGRCNSSPPVEIFLRIKDDENISLPQQDKQSVFYADGGQREEIDKVLWMIKHNGQKLKSAETNDNGELIATWGDFSGDVTVKFFAQFRNESCITYRRQNHTVTHRDDIPNPLLHVRLVDSKNPQNVSLASKVDKFDAYRYKKRQGDTVNENLRIEARFHADECQYAPPGSGVIPWKSCDQLANNLSIHQILTEDWTENDETGSCEDRPFVRFRMTNQGTDFQSEPKIHYHLFYKYCPLPFTNNDCYFVQNDERLETSHYRCVFIRDIPHDIEEKLSKTWSWNCSKRNCKFRHIINQQAPPNGKSYYSITEYNPFADNQPFTNVRTATQRTGVSGTYWIHIQAQDENSNQSTIHATSAILNLSPTTTTTTTTTTQ